MADESRFFITMAPLVVRDDLPALPTLSTSSTSSRSTSTSQTYTTPSVTVPANNNNPYILRQTNPSGTVFIAVGAIVGAILLVFISYHLFKSIRASRLAKRTSTFDNKFYEKYHQRSGSNGGNNNLLTPSGSTIFNLNTEYSPSVAKLPLLSHNPNKSFSGASQIGGFGDTSTIYQASDAGTQTSKNDLSRLFISPTAEVMTHKRARSGHFNGSTTNVSLIGGGAGGSVVGGSVVGGSQVNLNHPNTPGNRYSHSGIPNIYMNSDVDYSEGGSFVAGSSVVGSSNVASPQRRQEIGRSGKRTIPSMYLDDLIDQ